MKTMRKFLACAILLAAVSACTSTKNILEAPEPLPLCTKKEREEADGGIGGTGNTPIDCRYEMGVN